MTDSAYLGAGETARRIQSTNHRNGGDPAWASFPLVGWFQAKTLSEQMDCHLVPQIHDRRDIKTTGWRELTWAARVKHLSRIRR